MSIDYSTVRYVHIACAGITIALFAIRGSMQLGGIDWRRWRWLRTLPHVNDTVLLATAIMLAITSAQYPVAQPWLTAKVVALIAYIALGSIALRPSVSAPTRLIAFAAALATVGYIVMVAVTRSVTLALPAG